MQSPRSLKGRRRFGTRAGLPGICCASEAAISKCGIPSVPWVWSRLNKVEGFRTIAERITWVGGMNRALWQKQHAQVTVVKTDKLTIRHGSLFRDLLQSKVPPIDPPPLV